MINGLLFLSLRQEGSPTPERIRRALDAVFGRPEFNPASRRVDVQQSLVDFFTWLGSLSTTSPLQYWLLLIGCLLLLTVLVAHISWTILSAFSAARRFRRAGESVRQRRRLSAAAATAADQAATAGDYTEAVRCLFLALVYHFDENGRIIYSPSGTNREYLLAFADRPGVLRDLAVFVDILDDNWYGQQPTPPEQYHRCRELFARMDQLAGEERAAA